MEVVAADGHTVDGFKGANATGFAFVEVVVDFHSFLNLGLDFWF